MRSFQFSERTVQIRTRYLVLLNEFSVRFGTARILRSRKKNVRQVRTVVAGTLVEVVGTVGFC